VDPYWFQADQYPLPTPDPGLSWQFFTTLQLKKNQIFIKKCKDVQATGEAFSPHKRISSTSKHDFFPFHIFVVNFCHPGSDSNPADQN
jgi:hypothetical protein